MTTTRPKGSDRRRKKRLSVSTVPEVGWRIATTRDVLTSVYCQACCLSTVGVRNPVPFRTFATSFDADSRESCDTANTHAPVSCGFHLCWAVTGFLCGRPTSIQCGCWEELCSPYKAARPQPSTGYKSCTHGSRNFIQYWGKGSWGIFRLQFCTV